ncbi:MAG: alkaline phosphatase family protein [Candidatus Sericytochromatia bacterium]|nr:alkaline phosphatase family protein [Candidatus Sericytochromatia bacterium]
MAGLPQASKPLHLVVIDSWLPAAVASELQAGRLPALAHLLAHGTIDYGCTTTFPSVTPACLAALATGVGPERNHITGVLWYDRHPDRYVHYWPYPQSLVWGTLTHVLGDFFLRMNAHHLNASQPTLFEALESRGVRAAAVNFPLSRGSTLHRACVPWLLRQLGGLPREWAVAGPRYLRLGDLVPGDRPVAGGLWRKYGFNDRASAAYSAELIRQVRPDFMLTYFNENDLRTHHHGPDGIGWSLRRVDQELGRLLEAYGSWDRAVREARWMIVGDHGQSHTFPWRSGHAVNVFKAFPDFRVAPLRDGGLRSNGHDFAVGPNDRMCYFYFHEGRAHLRDTIRDRVSEWPAVDQVLWREGDTCWAFSPARRARLGWQSGGPIRDAWGQAWTLFGDPGALDGRLEGERFLDGAYPNCLARAHGALNAPQASTLILTARLGYEFTSGFPMGRANHGSLHRLDSCVPLVTVDVQAPALARITDLYEVVMHAMLSRPVRA